MTNKHVVRQGSQEFQDLLRQVAQTTVAVTVTRAHGRAAATQESRASLQAIMQGTLSARLQGQTVGLPQAQRQQASTNVLPHSGTETHSKIIQSRLDENQASSDKDSGVDYDEPIEKVIAFQEKMKTTYPMALDPGAEIFAQFALKRSGVTRNVVIDKEGKIAFLTRLFDKKEFNAMKKKIAEIL